MTSVNDKNHSNTDVKSSGEGDDLFQKILVAERVINACAHMQSGENCDDGKEPNKKQLQTAQSKSLERLNMAVFEYLMQFLDAEKPGTETCRQISTLEARLRDTLDNGSSSSGSSRMSGGASHLHCVARASNESQRLRENTSSDDKNQPIYCARTHRNEPCPYYLQLAIGEKHFQSLLAEEGTNERDNSVRLEETGLRVRDRHEENKSARHLKLPADLKSLNPTNSTYFDRSALLHFAPHVDLQCLERHATLAARDTIGDDLCGTMIQVMRTAVTLIEWSQNDVREKLIETVHKRLPFVQKPVLGTIREDVIPIGFHILGATTDRTYGVSDDDTGKKIVLIDIYAWQVRRFYVKLSRSVHEEMHADSSDISDFITPLAIAAGVADEELRKIKSLADVERNFVFEIVDDSSDEVAASTASTAHD